MTVLASMLAYFQSFIPGSRLIDGGDLKTLVNTLFQTTSGITALAGGGQTGATQLNPGLNRVDTVASANDSVLLPYAIPGNFVVVYNNTATDAKIYGNPANPQNPSAASPQGQGDTIAASTSNTQQATATGVTLANSKVSIFYCFVLGQWKQLLTA